MVVLTLSFIRQRVQIGTLRRWPDYRSIKRMLKCLGESDVVE
jgi:hypothetical protein